MRRAIEVPHEPPDASAVPTLLTSDPDLVAAVERLAAAAGVRLATAYDDASVLARWREAPVLLVGADLVDAVARLRPARREDVHVVTTGASGTATYRAAVAVGAATVLELPGAASWLTTVLALHEEPTRAGPQVAVLGGSGGVGATTFAAAVVTVGARSGPVLAVDVDPCGAGFDRHLGLDDDEGLRWDSLGLTSGRLSGRALREAVPRRDGVGVLGWSASSQRAEVPVEGLREVLAAGARGHDLVVVDLPRAPGPAGLEAAVRSDLLVLVVRPTLTGVASARRVLATVGEVARVGVVVRGRGVGEDEVAAALDVPVVATVGTRARDVEAVELGLGGVRPRASLARAAREVLDLVGAGGDTGAGGGVGAAAGGRARRAAGRADLRDVA